MTANTHLMAVFCAGTVTFDYVNYRNERSTRRAVFQALYYGTTPYHKEPQWFMKALDLDKNEIRDFALADMSGVIYEP